MDSKKTDNSAEARKLYITMLGRSVWAVINTYYSVLREKQYFPDEILLFVEGKDDPALKEKLKKTLEGLKILSDSYGIEPEIHYELISECVCDVESDDDFVKAAIRISNLIKKRKAAGDTIAVDITPGKKTLVAGTLLPIKLNDLDYLFYLSAEELMARPYMMIPYQIQQINDFKEQVMRVMH